MIAHTANSSVAESQSDPKFEIVHLSPEPISYLIYILAIVCVSASVVFRVDTK